MSHDQQSSSSTVICCRYKIENLQSAQNTDLLSDVDIVYVEGFFLSHSPLVVMDIISRFTDKIHVLNLCGEYVCRDQEYCDNVLKIISNVKVVFGNKDELKVFLQTSIRVASLGSREESMTLSLFEALDESKDIPNLPDNVGADEDDAQYFIATDAQHPIQCFILK